MRSDQPVERPQAAINVTPLVDVCLVLLIIFLVVTPLMDHHAVVQLPEANRPGRIEAAPEKVVLSVSYPDKAMWYRESWLPEREMLDALRELHARAESKKLVVIADKRLSYGDVRGLLRLVRRAGFEGAEIAARREER